MRGEEKFIGKMKLKPETKKRLMNVTTVAKFSFQFGFVPFLLYLGKKIIDKLKTYKKSSQRDGQTIKIIIFKLAMCVYR